MRCTLNTSGLQWWYFVFSCLRYHFIRWYARHTCCCSAVSFSSLFAYYLYTFLSFSFFGGSFSRSITFGSSSLSVFLFLFRFFCVFLTLMYFYTVNTLTRHTYTCATFALIVYCAAARISMYADIVWISKRTR